MKNACEEIIGIDIHQPVRFHWSGLFVAPDGQWAHMHRRLADFEMMAVQRGTLYIEDDRGQYEVCEGEYILMPPTPAQKGYRPSDCAFYWMHFVSAVPDGYREYKGEPQAIAFEEKYLTLPKFGKLISANRVFSLMQQLSDMEKRYLDPQANSFLATAVLCEIQNQMKNGGADSKSRILSERIKDYVASHISEELHVVDVAARFGYNEKYLTTLFRKQSNISLKQYIISAKIERAKFLLCNTNASISEIAYNLSYWNVQSFSTAFKKFTEVSPTEYRQLYAGGRVNRV